MSALILIASLLQGPDLGEIEQTLKGAVDRDGFENGAYAAARTLASIPGEDAMGIRLRMFDKKMETYNGVFLRDWFYSGMQKATSLKESEMLLNAAASQKNSLLLRLLSVRALRHSEAPIPSKGILSKNLMLAVAPVRREWQALLGEAYAANRIQFPEKEMRQKDEKIRESLMTSGSPWLGHEFVTPISEDEEKEIKATAQRAKLFEDRSEALRILSCHSQTRQSWLESAKDALADSAWGPRTATLQSAQKESIVEAVPLIIEALENQSEGGRWPGDLADALYTLTGNQFGSDAQLWRRWWQEKGQEFLEQDQPAKKKPPPDERSASASFFGIPVDSNSLVILVDGSGSMKMDKIGDRTCAEAATDEIEAFLDKLAPRTLTNLALISTQPFPAFKKSKRNSPQARKQALSFLRKSQFRGTSALVDALIWAQHLEGVDTILLVSDGGSSSGLHQYSEHMLEALIAEYERTGVRIHGICVGPDKRKAAFMGKLAESTGGRVVKPSG